MRRTRILSTHRNTYLSIVTLLVATVIAVNTSRAQAPTTASGTAPQVRYVDQDGIRYRETRTTVQQPVRDYRYVDVPQTYYLQRYRTDYVNQTSLRQVPNTRYECVPRLYDWWRVLGVFGEPYVAYGIEPTTTWQAIPETRPTAVVRREVMPQTRTVKVPVPYLKMVERENISRVAVGPATGRPSRLAQQPNSPRYPGAPSSRVAIGPQPQPIFVPATSRDSIPPSEPNPFGGWSVANRGSTVAPRRRPDGGSQANSSESTSQDPRFAGQGLPERFGGIARMDGDFPRFGTGPLQSGTSETLQATRPTP